MRYSNPRTHSLTPSHFHSRVYGKWKTRLIGVRLAMLPGKKVGWSPSPSTFCGDALDTKQNNFDALTSFARALVVRDIRRTFITT